MNITLKLYASLSEFLPAGAVENTVQIEVPERCSLNEVIDRYRVPRRLAHLVLINGHFIEESQRDEPMLKEGDALAIWPPVAGG